MKPLNRREVVLVVGAPDCGKTSYVMAHTAGAPRRLIWDPMNQYQGELVRSPSELLIAVESFRGPAVIRYVPRLNMRAEFEAFCIAALAWRDCWVMVEELADVSHAGKAPDWWGRVLREHRHARLRVYATTQRPKESDKTILGVISKAAIFWMPSADDRLDISRKLSIPIAMLDALPEQLEFIETDGKRATRGRLSFA